MAHQDLLRTVVSTLDAAGIQYMVTGSIASSLQGEPRLTHDLDFVVAIAPGQVPALLQAFPAPEYYVSATAVAEALQPYIDGYGDGEDEDDIAKLPQWQRDGILEVRAALESDDLVALPGKFDVHEWDIMRRFSSSRPEPARGALLDAIRGRGAFRAFRRALDVQGLREEWFSFRDDAVRQLATDWLNENGIAFSDD